MAHPVVLHNPNTLLHHSKELVAHNLIDAHESADRIRRIVKSLIDQAQFKLITIEDVAEDIHIPPEIHDELYIKHLKTIFQRFVEAGAVEENACILPECFPHHALLQLPNSHKQPDQRKEESEMNSNDTMRQYVLPRDPFAHLGYYSFDMSSGMSKDTYKSVACAVNLALKGVDYLMEGKAHPPAILALTRPPGHHACHALAGGYCYINNVAFAAEYLLSKLGTTQPNEAGSRVVILDLDFHHGNGTQSIFYSRREPAYISIHGEGEYPYYTGSTNERGQEEGLGYNRNLPLPAYPSSTKSDYFNLLDEALTVIRDEWMPAYLLLSMGFDTFKADPLGGFDLDIEDYRVIGARVKGLGIPLLALLEGGYSNELGDLVVEFLEGLKCE
jgi:acetoin utilization deacetylase AcuC-like enzyme